MDERRFYENILDLKPPWTVWNVILNRKEHALHILYIVQRDQISMT
jgi:hypothetical protein